MALYKCKVLIINWAEGKKRLANQIFYRQAKIFLYFSIRTGDNNDNGGWFT